MVLLCRDCSGDIQDQDGISEYLSSLYGTHDPVFITRLAGDNKNYLYDAQELLYCIGHRRATVFTGGTGTSLYDTQRYY